MPPPPRSLVNLSTATNNNNKIELYILSTTTNNRYCDMCNENVLDDERHLLFQCQNVTLVQYRNNYKPHYYRSRPSMFKCVAMICKLEDRQLAIKVGAFLKKAFSLVK